MTIKGFPSGRKTGLEQEFVTVQPINSDKFGLDIVLNALYEVSNIDFVPEAGSTDKVIKLTAHTFQKGDVLLFNAGALVNYKVAVSRVTANDITLGNTLPVIPSASETFRQHRYTNLATDASGGLASGPMKIKVDGVAEEVSVDTANHANDVKVPTFMPDTQKVVIRTSVNGTPTDVNTDTATPSNTVSLPVEVYGTKFKKDGVLTEVKTDSTTPANTNPMPQGLHIMKDDGKWYPVVLDQTNPYAHNPIPVCITDVLGAGNVNVDLSGSTMSVNLHHNGASPSSVQIGDGTNVMGVNASNEAKTIDTAARASLSSIDGKLTGAATSAKQDTGNASLASIDTKMDAQATASKQDSQTVILASIDAHIDGLETLVGATNTALASIEGYVDGLEALGTAGNASLGSIDTKLSSQATAAKQDTGNTSLNSIDTKINALATSTKQDTAQASLTSIDGKLTGVATSAAQTTGNASLSSIDTKMDAQATAANQVITNNKLDTLHADLAGLGAIGVQHFGVATTINQSGGAFVQLVASTATAIKRIKADFNFGDTVVIYVGASGFETSVGYMGLGGGDLTFTTQIPVGSRVSIKLLNTATLTGVNFIWHLLG